MEGLKQKRCLFQKPPYYLLKRTVVLLMLVTAEKTLPGLFFGNALDTIHLSPQLGGQHFDARNIESHLPDHCHNTAKEPYRCYNSIPFFMDFYPLFCRGKNYFVNFSFQ